MMAPTRARPPLTLVPAQRGAPEARAEGLDDAFRNYAAYVATIGIRILGNDDEVDDLVQDVFIEAARGLRQVREAGAVKGWLGTIAVRVASRRLKRRRLRRFLGLSEEQEAPAWPGASPEQSAAIAHVYRLLDQVPARHRAAWILRVVEGEPIDEVARLCDCSRATVKRWIQAVQERVERSLGHG
jgi:RNA polymerase sigma-70 factor (ECF subfamily)